MPTLTYYSVSADLTTLYAILNGVAMICQQTTDIWAFALAVSLYRLMSTAVSATFRSASGAGAGIAALGSGGMSAFIPFLLAFVLTNPGLKGTVQIESTVNGAVNEVDHVPIVISAIPAAGSVLSLNLNQLVSTAFQNADSEYPTISATANGFMNPLKILLTSRTAMVRLGGVDSEVKTVLASCLGPDSGVNYASIQNLVLNAGNTGATAAQSLEINGQNPTALGALLYQASQNTSGMVNDPGLDATNMLSCAAAAQQVANDITTALNSVEFTRVIQGAVNGLDQPIPGADYSFDTIAAQYDAVATANTLGNVFAGGTGQANAEFMNMLFSEMVGEDLNCLRASGNTLTECQATALQASEVERNNLQEAASEVPMLRYAGSFGNYLIALIIGLGPVIVMFMMFAGVEAGKMVKTTAHIIVWPMLVVNVGAELVNGMICIDVANYLESIRQGGWLSQATTFAAYKELSLQIGTGSHIMASLPVLMSVIFGLGESSAITSVGSSIAPKSTDVSENVAPKPEATRPMFENSSVAAVTQLANGAGRMAFTGGLEAVSTNATFGASARDASRTLTQSDTLSKSLTEGQTNLREWRAAAESGDFSRLGVDNSVGQSVLRNWAAEQRAGADVHAGSNVTGIRRNFNSSQAGMHGEIGAGAGSESGWSLGGGANASTQTGAENALQAATDGGRNRTYNSSASLSRAIQDTISQNRNSSAGQQSSNGLSRSLSTQLSYQKSLSEVQSSSDATSQALHNTDNFADMSTAIHGTEIAWQQRANPEFAAFQLAQGRRFDVNPANQKYLRIAQADSSGGATDRVVGDPAAQGAINRHRAAVMLRHDTTASAEDRLSATRYLADEANAMLHMRYMPGDTSPRDMHIAPPTDNTRVNVGGLRNEVDGRTAALPGLTVSPTSRRAPPVPPSTDGARRVGRPEDVAGPLNVSGVLGNRAADEANVTAPITRVPGGSGVVGTEATGGMAELQNNRLPPVDGRTRVVSANRESPPRATQSDLARTPPSMRNQGRSALQRGAIPAPLTGTTAGETGRRRGVSDEPTLRTPRTAIAETPRNEPVGLVAGRSADQTNLDPGLKAQVEGELGEAHAYLDRHDAAVAKTVSNAGLDPDGHGTVARTAANVADNVADVTRPIGSPSRTGLGDIDHPPESGNSKPKNEQPSTSRFVRR